MGEQENADIKHIGSLPSLICASIKSSGVYKVKKKKIQNYSIFYSPLLVIEFLVGNRDCFSSVKFNSLQLDCNHIFPFIDILNHSWKTYHGMFLIVILY